MSDATIEDVKTFWDSRPCNVRHSAKPIGTQEYFDEVERKKFIAEPHIKEFSDFGAWNNKRVLEIGSGIGTMAINFARAGADYTGVELSEASMELTKQRFDVYGYRGNFYVGNAEELTKFVPVEPYDLVYSWGVIHHSPNPGKIVQQAQQYLKPGGTLKLMIYAKNSWKNYMIEAGFDQPEAQYGCPIAFTYTEQEAIDLIGSDFEVESITQDHIFPYQVEPYKQGSYIKQPWFDAMPAEMFRVLERRLGWHLMVTAKLKG